MKEIKEVSTLERGGKERFACNMGSITLIYFDLNFQEPNTSIYWYRSDQELQAEGWGILTSNGFKSGT